MGTVKYRQHRNKSHLMVRRGVLNVYKSLRRIQPKYTQSPVWLVGHHQWHRSIQSETTVQWIGKNIQVVQPVRLTISVKGHTLFKNCQLSLLPAGCTDKLHSYK